MKIKLISLLLLIPAFHLCAQPDQPLHFEKINGLSQNTVYSIIKDKQGFMWIATANGLNRYDGAEMKTYKPSFEIAKGMMEGRIVRSAMLEDEKDQIWFGTEVAINSFNKKNQEFSQHKLYWSLDSLKPAEGTPQTNLFANPLLKKDNIIWFATASEGLFALNVITNKCANYPVTLRDENGRRISLMYNAEYNKDKLWFATKQGLLCFDLNTHQWTDFFKGQSFFTLLFYADTLYLGSDNRIDWFDTKSFKSGKAIKKNEPSYTTAGMIRRIIVDGKMNLWAGDQQGNIYSKSKEKNEFVWRGNINGNLKSRTNYPVYCLYADTTGNLWVGADVLGLLKAEINPGVFKKYPDDVAGGDNRQNLFIYSIYEDEKNNMWLGTFQNGLFVINKSTGEAETVNFPFYDPNLPYAKSVPLITSDSSGNLWTSYSGFLYVREKGQKGFKPVKIPIPANALQMPQLWSVVEYNKGWLIGTNIGLYKVFKEGKEYRISYMQNFGQSRVIKLWVAPDHKVWVVPESGGIMIYKNPADAVEEDRIFKSLNVKSIEYDEGHQLVWISTTNGIMAYHLPSSKHKFYTEQGGLVDNYVYGVMRINNEFWASTNNGLSKGLIEFKKDSSLPEVNFINYTMAEGLPANEFNTGSFYKGKSGTLYFGSTKGVVWFNPLEIKSNSIVPKIQLINFLVNEEVADSSLAPEYISSASFPYYKNNLFFQFRGIDFNNADKVRYKYQLEGWDKDWIYSNMLNEVRYNNLPHGQYLFKVMAEGSSGVWSNEVRTVSILIYPPFWKTWWFYTLGGLSMLLVIVFITRYFSQQKLKNKITELQKQKEIDKERQRISREMHDDIGAGLTQITLMTESVKNKSAGIAGKELDDITTTSRKLVSNMSEIIWSLNTENKTLDQFCSYLREELNKQLEYANMEYTIQLPENRKDIILTNEQRRNLLLVTKEIVNNAIKYSKAKNIMVNAKYDQEALHFEISDNGIGFDTEKNFNGNGLRNIKQRTEELGGRLIIRSSDGNGSYFNYEIPLQ